MKRDAMILAASALCLALVADGAVAQRGGRGGGRVGDQGLHAGYSEKGKREEGLLYDRQQHLGGGKKGN